MKFRSLPQVLSIAAVLTLSGVLWRTPDAAADPPLPPRNGGSRGGICAIAPNFPRGVARVWSDRPLFVWQGDVSKVEVYANDANSSPLWRYEPQAEEQQVLYDGESLQAGQIYFWVVFNRRSLPVYRIPFQILPADQRPAIANELATLEHQLRADRASPSTEAPERINYFAERQLWADAMREAFSVETPSPDVTTYIEAATSQICGR